MAETILVTGATGNVGSEVVKQLSRNRLEVNIVAAVHSVKNAKRIEDDGIEVVSIDYNKPESLSAAFKDADKLFLLTPFQSDMVQHSSNLLTEVKNVGTLQRPSCPATSGFFIIMKWESRFPSMSTIDDIFLYNSVYSHNHFFR
jgi:NAD(P)-dependent dehydrogenase (short-subunit alcohol dehydrogenase family)